MLIRIGTRGRAVILLQLQLRYLGFYRGLITGVVDSITEQSIRSYQAAKRLSVDGIAGNVTRTALAKDANEALLVLFLHCAATPEGRDVKAASVVSWHTLPPPQGRGWDRCGYSDIIELDGKLVNTRSWDSDDKISTWEFTHGVQVGTLLNRNARHVCYIGGVDSRNVNIVKDTRTGAQKQALETYVKFHLLRYPQIVVLGHGQIQADKVNGCPSFDVPKWLREIGVSDYNIGVFGAMLE